MNSTLVSTWNGKFVFDSKLPQGEQWTLASVPADARPGPGPSPMEAVLGAVAGCTGMDVVLILEKMRKPPRSLRIEVEGTRRDEHPRIFTRIDLTYHMEGADLDAASATRAVEMSLTKYCSVSAMLKETVEFGSKVVLNGERL